MGTLGYINSRINPIDTSKLGAVGVTRPHSAAPARLLASSVADGIAIEAPFSRVLTSAVAIDARGRSTPLSDGVARVLWKVPRGLWILRATDASGATYQSVIAAP